MTWSSFVLAFGAMVAGGFGAVARYLLDLFLPVWKSLRVSTLLINLSGSFLVGFSIGLMEKGLSSTWGTIISIGFLGGFTTFSATSLQIAELILRRRFGVGLVVAALQLILSVVLVVLGFVVAQAV